MIPCADKTLRNLQTLKRHSQVALLCLNSINNYCYEEESRCSNAALVCVSSAGK